MVFCVLFLSFHDFIPTISIPHRCHLEPPIVVISSLSRDLFLRSFSRSLREKDQKRGATPKAPFKGGCKRESRTTDDSRASLASRDTRYSLLQPCCRRPLERDSQVRGESVISVKSVFVLSSRAPIVVISSLSRDLFFMFLFSLTPRKLFFYVSSARRK